jgi:spore coat protein A
MFSRRKFVKSAIAGASLTSISAFLPKSAFALTEGTTLASGTWAIATDLPLFTKVWAARFTNVLPWALDRSNTVLAKALNLPTSGVTLNPSLPLGIGFVYNPDPVVTGAPAPVTPTYTIKAGQIDWPMLAPLGNTAGIPTTKTWGYGNKELETAYANGGGLPVTFPGRTFVVRRNAAIHVNWTNDLVDADNNPLPHLLGVDQSISMQNDQSIRAVSADKQEVYTDSKEIFGVPIAVHHHGGDTAQEFDGGPDQWISPRRVQAGPGVTGPNDGTADGIAGLKYTYDNTQEASMHWYHDHGEGVTRINAYGGLAGLYVVRDANEDKLVAQGKIPSGPYELPVVLQDKTFTADGSLSYSADPADYPVVDLTLPSPTHLPEQFGDVIVVNGVAWPKLDVEPREYRLRLLNGSDSRVYVLEFGFGGVNRRGGFNQYLPMYKISTDLGFLNRPVYMRQVIIAPGERMDIVVDFGWATLALDKLKQVVMVNSGAVPFPLGAPTVANTMGAGTVMKFNVNQPLNAATKALGLPNLPRSKVAGIITNLINPLTLRGLDAATPALTPLAVPAGTKVRRVLLAEGVDDHQRIMPLLGSFQMLGDAPYLNYPNERNVGTLSYSQLPTETPKLGTTEVWEFWNNTVDAHPIHMHLVKFRLLNRQAFGPSPLAPIDQATGLPVMAETKQMVNDWTGERLIPDAVLLSKKVVPAPADEQGWKDTILCYPGEVTRVVMSFDRIGKYVYHCHILSHEEHDMMRWYEVVA